jgi:hypothetical protein
MHRREPRRRGQGSRGDSVDGGVVADVDGVVGEEGPEGEWGRECPCRGAVSGVERYQVAGGGGGVDLAVRGHGWRCCRIGPQRSPAGRVDGYQWPGGEGAGDAGGGGGCALETARNWRDKRPGQLPDELNSFIDRSYRAECLRLSHDRRRAITFAILAVAASVLAVAALGAAIFASRQTAAARSERDLAILIRPRPKRTSCRAPILHLRLR